MVAAKRQRRTKSALTSEAKEARRNKAHRSIEAEAKVSGLEFRAICPCLFKEINARIIPPLRLAQPNGDELLTVVFQRSTGCLVELAIHGTAKARQNLCDLDNDHSLGCHSKVGGLKPNGLFNFHRAMVPMLWPIGAYGGDYYYSSMMVYLGREDKAAGRVDNSPTLREVARTEGAEGLARLLRPTAKAF